MNPGTLLIRADASVAIGTGHVMRCLALAQAWRDLAGGSVVFAMAESTRALAERLKREGILTVALNGSASETRQVLDLAVEHSASWVVVDGYQFDDIYYRDIKQAGVRVLQLDDLGRAIHYSADLILNQNAYAEEISYRDRERSTHLLLGPRYALLRREFTRQVDRPREMPVRARRVLVSMGGSDPGNATLRIVQALTELTDGDLEVRVVLGGSNPHAESVAKQIEGCRGRVELFSDVSEMRELMEWADVAVANAGTICWELCRMGLPAIAVVLADNQRPVAEALKSRGAAAYLRDVQARTSVEIAQQIRSVLDDPAARTNLSESASRLVDGKGTARVVLALKSYEVRLRPATDQDRELLWIWANDPDVRAASFSTKKISWEEHLAWFEAKTNGDNAHLFVALDHADVAIGQIRLDCTGENEAEIDISVSREQRGKDFASLIIERAAQIAFSGLGLNRLHAYVKCDNEVSGRAFARADFRRDGNVNVLGNPAVHYVRDRTW